MRIDILTLFPEMFRGVFDESMVKLAGEKGLARINIHNLRQWTHDKHRTVDDKPFGGGPGMVMKIEPVDEALSEIKSSAAEGVAPVIVLLTPQGKLFNQRTAKALSILEHVVLICGHYEGFDERIRGLVDLELSIGDYVLTCGEIPAMAICDAVIRLMPGVLGAEEGLIDESFENGLLEYPQYTRPADYKGMKVPGVLLSGDPKKIEKWRKVEAIERTRRRRPDLLNSERREK
jgi:tRNA (guanine37-N1)-methyltransferase